MRHIFRVTKGSAVAIVARATAVALGIAIFLANSSCAEAQVCPNSTSLGTRSYLPECRGYELLSPPYKGGFQVEVHGISEDGAQVLIESFGNFSGTEDTAILGQPYGIVRTGTEWKITPFDAPYSRLQLYTLETISPDFARSLWAAFPFTPPQDIPSEGIYRGPPAGDRASSEGLWTRVGPAEPPSGGGPALELVGASDDLSHAIYADTSPGGGGGEADHLWPCDKTTEGRRNSLYEYSANASSEPLLVGVRNEGRLTNNCKAELVSRCGTYLGSAPPADGYNAVSRDGSVVFFTATASEPCGGISTEPRVDELYARIDGEQTVSISEPTAAECEACDTSPSDMRNAQFRGASLNGSRVFFITEQHLLPTATGEGAYLYEYDFAAPTGRKIKLISGGTAEPDVMGVLRVSEDGSHVYFVAGGVLTGANDEHKAPILGSPNMYVWTAKCPNAGEACENPEEHLSFVATLSPTDDNDWTGQDVRPAQTTPEGRFIVFQSVADLTSDQEGQAEAGQIFEYDAQTQKLVRVSRGKEGYNNDGNSSSLAATIPVQNFSESRPISRPTFLAVSADGSKIFFSSEDGLTPQATSGVNNVYEYHAGEVDLISDGHDSVHTVGQSAVFLFGTDSSGADVFFLTADRLVPQDTDNQTDLYDARIDGGVVTPVANAPCGGDSCQNSPIALSAPPVMAPALGESPVPTVTMKNVKHHKSRPRHKGHGKKVSKHRNNRRSRKGKG